MWRYHYARAAQRHRCVPVLSDQWGSSRLDRRKPLLEVYPTPSRALRRRLVRKGEVQATLPKKSMNLSDRHAKRRVFAEKCPIFQA